MKTRKLKIESHQEAVRGSYKTYSGRQTRGSSVRLKGKWLQAAGFPAGMSVLVTVISPGVIELRLENVRAADGEYLIAADRLDVALAKARQ